MFIQVRFQYEEYPEDTKQAWRQVFLVQDVEIRDRLSSSQINKLLYQYSTEARPRQTHANMVCSLHNAYFIFISLTIIIYSLLYSFVTSYRVYFVINHFLDAL